VPSLSLRSDDFWPGRVHSGEHIRARRGRSRAACRTAIIASTVTRWPPGASPLAKGAEGNVTAHAQVLGADPAGEPDAGTVIETAALTKRYSAQVIALDELTVSVAAGITGLVGANGAGKSTLIKILLGLLAPTKGKASVLGHDCGQDGEKIRSLTGYMPEHDCLLPDVTATEFVTHMGRMSGLPPTAAKERAAEALRHVGLYEERYRPAGTYSTGMKQRVKLAQALVGDPRLLLLDEPTIGLDPAGRVAMLDLISRIGANFGISIVVASHLLGELEQICDHIVAIDSGRLLRADTVTSFTRAIQVLAIEVEEGAGPLLGELRKRGLDAQPQERAVLVRLAGEDTYDVVRDAIADLGLPLNRMEQRRHRIEELFRDQAEPGEMTGAAGAS
jgi:ABC-2 type transport system ATP-binding protein